MQNLPVYILTLLFLAMGVRFLLRRHRGADPYRHFLLMLVPAFLLVPIMTVIGLRQAPRHEIVIHGYRVAVPDDNKIYLGSDPKDHISLHHRIKDQEMMTGGLVEIAFPGRGKQTLITQTETETPNTVQVGGMSIRALELEPGKTHRITFKGLNYSEAPKDTLELEVPKLVPLLGDLALGRPEFRFRGQTFHEGFSHPIGWILAPLLPNLATESGQVRHLAYNNRIFHRALDGPEGSLLAQAALMRKGNTYYLFANDAQIHLDGRAFPNQIEVEGAPRIQISSRQLGTPRFATSFKLVPPSKSRPYAYMELSPRHKRHLKLPPISVADRICLSKDGSAYSQAYDIQDDQFPVAGTIISREGGRFIFRGQTMEMGRPYSCGNTVFSIEQQNSASALTAAGYALLFMLSALFLPASTLRAVPLLAPVMATAIYLHALRQILAFRAWMAPPYNLNVFLDSAAAPYLLVLCVSALIAREPFYHLLKRGLVRIHNYLRPSHGMALAPRGEGAGALATLLLILYGLLLASLFWNRLGADFLMVIGLFATISVLMGRISHWERSLSARPLDTTPLGRYLPNLSLLALFLLALISAPLLGGREIIPFLPGRPRPDILIQVVLILLVAYQAGLWERERRTRVANLALILLTYSAIFLLPLIQGVVARDLGFFVVVAIPLLIILLTASWVMERRIKALFFVSLAILIALPIWFKVQQVSLDNVAAQRIAFWLDKPRLRAEHFFDYQAQVPILWASGQGPMGGGYFTGDWYSALSSTCVNDNVASVFVQGELGGIGTILIMALYGLLAITAPLFVRDHRDQVGGFRVWVILGVALTFVWTATAMFLQNLGYLPLTGKNLPFLGLDSLNDTLRYGLLLGLMLRYMREFEE